MSREKMMQDVTEILEEATKLQQLNKALMALAKKSLESYPKNQISQNSDNLVNQTTQNFSKMTLK